jgi:predicted amidohydrolase YtcJ
MTKSAPTADLILHRGLFTTLARAHPTATAVAIRDGRFLAVDTDKEAMALAGPKTKVVDLKAGESYLG